MWELTNITTDLGNRYRKITKRFLHISPNSQQSQSEGPRKKMEGLWKISTVNLQAVRYMLSSQAPLPVFCVLLIEARDKVDYIFFSLHLFPVSLAVNQEVESLGETALIIKFRIFHLYLLILLSLSLYLCIIFTQSANHNQLQLIFINVHRVLTVSWVRVQLSGCSRF